MSRVVLRWTKLALSGYLQSVTQKEVRSSMRTYPEIDIDIHNIE